jgi:uncharacterized metal-binding protein YceD (DUF177 family)
MQALFVGAAVDLNELVLQEFTLTLPINPVCSPECDPVCSNCGRARSHCCCATENREADSRWQYLLEELNARRGGA